LAVVGGLSDGPEPRPQVGLELGVAHVAGDRGSQVRGDQLAVDVLGHRLERLEMALHMPRERGDPRRDRDRVAQRHPVEAPSLEQHQPQRDRAADVVTGDARPVQLPEVEQLDEDPSLRSDRHVLALALLGCPVAEQIADVDREPLRECAGHVAPQVRPARRPVHQQHRGAVPEHLVGDRAAR
jgi:hypothetical protein